MLLLDHLLNRFLTMLLFRFHRFSPLLLFRIADVTFKLMISLEDLLLELALFSLLQFIRLTSLTLDLLELKDAVDDMFELDTVLLTHRGLLGLVLHWFVVGVFQQC